MIKTNENQLAEDQVVENHSAIPPAPTGYGPPEQFHYPHVALIIANLLLAVALLPALGWLTWQLQGRPDALGFSFDFGDLLLLFAAAILTIVVHEWLHGLVLRRFGFRVSYGVLWKMGGAYAAAFHQFITRNQTLWVAAMPLIVITVCMFPLLAVPTRSVVMVAFTALLINTSAAVGDLYLIGRLLRMPVGTLLYDVSLDCMLLYRPGQHPIQNPGQPSLQDENVARVSHE